MSDDYKVCFAYNGCSPNNGGTKTKGKKKQKQTHQMTQPQRHVISIDTDQTFQSIRQVIKEKFAINSSNKAIVFKAGFPPKPVIVDDPANTLARSIFSKNDRVQINIIENGTNTSQKGTSEKTKTTTKSSSATTARTTTTATGGGGRSKRAAAKAASESFKDVIREQDKILKQEKEKQQKKKRSTPTSSNSSPAKRTNNNNNNLAAQRKMAKMAGRRLQDGANVGPKNGNNSVSNSNTGSINSNSSSSSPAGRKRKAAGGTRSWSSEDDVSADLMSALSGGGGGGGGKIGMVLRKAMKNMVLSSYEKTKAQTRVNSIQSGNYMVRRSSEVGTTKTLQVRYSKGIEGRGFHEENVDYIPKDVLINVISSIYNTSTSNNDNDDGTYDDGDHDENSNSNGKEMLRPANLAQLSPRVFWSLIYHHTHNDNVDSNAAVSSSNNNNSTDDGSNSSRRSSVEDGLQELLPNLDWSYLRRRNKTLSSKAKENLRQQREHERHMKQQEQSNTSSENDSSNDVDNIDAANKVISDVENAMEQLSSYDYQNKRQRMIQAALQRQNNNQKPQNEQHQGQQQNDIDEEDVWEITVPDEDDIDELKDCIMYGFANIKKNDDDDSKDDNKKTTTTTTTTTTEKDTAEKYAQLLISECNIKNWRQLAIITNVDTIVETINNNLNSKKAAAVVAIDKDMVELWIDYSQQQSIEEIIVEICDDSIDNVEMLRNIGKSGTPKDLSNWLHIPHMLYDTIIKGKVTNDNNDDNNDNINNITLDNIRKWCQRSYNLCQQSQYEWLNWYVTPV